jgi:hypothetical protein
VVVFVTAVKFSNDSSPGRVAAANVYAGWRARVFPLVVDACVPDFVVVDFDVVGVDVVDRVVVGEVVVAVSLESSPPVESVVPPVPVVPFNAVVERIEVGAVSADAIVGVYGPPWAVANPLNELLDAVSVTLC